MSESSDLEQLTGIVKTVHEALSRTRLSPRRCMYTCSVLMSFIGYKGFEIWYWQGSAIWYNRKHVELMQSGYDFSALAELPEAKRNKRLDALERRGARSVYCLANRPEADFDLGGHLCLIAQKDGRTYFIDPTAYQFRRHPESNKRPGEIKAPDFLIAEIDHTETPDINYMHPYEGGLGVYQHVPLDRMREIAKTKHRDLANTDMNPNRHPDLYAHIAKLLGLPNAYDENDHSFIDYLDDR